MNADIHSAFIGALLSDVAYVHGLSENERGEELGDDIQARLTSNLAEYVAQHFRVIKQTTESSSGFSVTVFEELSTSRRYIAFRGTEAKDLGDLIADLDIGIGSGLAFRQVLAMVNWYERATTPKGAQAIQLAETWRIVDGKITFHNYLAAGTGELVGSPNYVVSGHSLGGNLTTAFARLFGFDGLKSYTYNGAGFRASTRDIFTIIEQSLGIAATAYPGPDRQKNYFASHGINFATNSLVLSQLGERIPIFTEESTFLPNHYIFRLTDSLTLFDLMGTIDGGLLVATATQIADAASANPAASLESVLDTLRRLYQSPGLPRTLVGDSGGSSLSREDYHTKLASLRQIIEQQTPASIVTLTQMNAAAMREAALGGDGLPYRYALKELNPFAIVGQDALYARYNDGGKLELVDPSTSRGLTNEYLTDRAQFLVRKIERNNADATGALRDSKVLGSFDYQDRSTGESIRVIGPAGSEHIIIFGRDHVNETIPGKDGPDRLYGASGSDTINGGGEADYLEGGDNRDFLYGQAGDGDRLVGGAGDDVLDGGPGNDELFGGAGNDMYEYHAGEGVDNITDTDGQGFIRFWGRTSITTESRGGKQRGPNLWTTDDGLFRYSLFREEDGTDTLGIFSGSDVLFVSNFTSGDLRIVLEDPPPSPAPPWDLFPQTPNNDFYVRQSTATGAHIQGLAGNDFLIVEPYSAGAQEGSLVEGGTGSDALSGGSGNDRLFTETQDDLQALLEGNANTNPGINREVVLGNAGDDLLVGGRGSDWLGGGLGRDTIYGGAGDDVISGSGDAYFEQVAGLQPQEMLVFNVHDSALSGSAVESFLTAARAGDRIIRQGLNDQSPFDDGDLIFAGAGNDEVWGDYGDDELIGELGRDRLRGEAGNDSVFGGDGDDELYGDGEQVPAAQQGNDYLDGGSGQDVLYGGGGSDYLYGGDARDILNGESGRDYLYGEAGNDDLLGGADEDTLAGGPANDLLKGGAKDDTYVFEAGDGNDTVIDNEGVNRFVFGKGISARSFAIARSPETNNLAIQYGSAGDVVIIEGGYLGMTQTFGFADGSTYDLQQILNVGTTGAITLAGAGSGATLLGGSGDDALTAGNNDTLDGGRGNDTLTLPAGSATLRFTRGDGADVVHGSARSASLKFDDTIDPEAAVFFRVGLDDPRASSPRDLVLQYGDTGDSILIPDSPYVIGYGYSFGLGGFFNHVSLLERSGLGLDWLGSDEGESVTGTTFDDHLVGRGGQDTLSGLAGDDLLEGGAQGDTLNGGADNDVLTGGAGSDRLAGGTGDDRYVFDPGDGVDRIDDNGGAETIEIARNLDDVTAELVNGTDGNIYLAVGYGTGDTVLVRQNFDSGVAASTVTFRFASGEPLGSGELSSLKFLAPLDFRGANQALRITGSRFDDTLIGSTKDDRLEGGSGNDRIAGDAGSDFISGGAGDDLLVGNAGDDTLDGGAGADTYRFHRGMGRDLILEQAGDLNTITLTNSGLRPAEDLTAQRVGDDLHLAIRLSRDGVVIRDYFVSGASSFRQEWRVETEEGRYEPLQALIGDLQAPPRMDTLNDLLDDFRNRAAVFQESVLIAAGYVRQADGGYVRDEISDSALYSSHRTRTVVLANPVLFDDRASITRASSPVAQTGNSTSSTTTPRKIQELVSPSSFVPYASGGNHAASGAAGASRAFDVLGSAYTGLDYGHNFETVAGQNWTNDPLSGQLTASTSGYRVFTGPPQWQERTVDRLHDEQSFGYRFNFEVITAGASNNAIQTSSFSIVDAGSGDDTVTGKNGAFYVPGESSGGFFGDPEPLPNSPGALLYGNAGNDTLIGGAADDVLIGGTGDDTLQGGRGNDAYILFAGDGLDEIFEMGASAPGIARENVLRLPQGVALGDLSASWTQELRSAPFLEPGYGSVSPYPGAVQSLYAVLHVSFGGAERVRLVIPHAEQNAAAGIDFVDVGDGTRVPFGELLSLAPAQDLNPHLLDNTLTGSGVVYGGAGNDVIQADRAVGGLGSDTLIGTAGNDELIGGLPLQNPYGGFGSPVLGTLWDEGGYFRGGGGADKLWTTAGADTIEFDPGDGIDIVTDLQHDDLYYYYGGKLDFAAHAGLDETALDPAHQAALFGNEDTLKFGAGIAPGDILVYRAPSERQRDNAASDSLVFSRSGFPDEVRFPDWYRSPVFKVMDPYEQLSHVEFANGTVWDRATIDALAAAAPRLPIPPYLSPQSPTVRIGSAGDDVLTGDNGVDILRGGPGHDVLDGGGGNDIYYFQPGDGVDRIQESGVGTFDVLEFGPAITPDMLTLGVGSLLIRVGDTGDAVHIEGFDPDDALGSGTIEEFRFDGGRRLTYGEMLARGFDVYGTPNEDVIRGTSVEDRIDGYGGDDILLGGTGSDTYYFARGSGADVIEDGGGDADTVLLGQGIDPADVTATRSGNTVRLSIGRGADRLSLHQEPGTSFRIEQVRFAGGAHWDAAFLEAISLVPSDAESPAGNPGAEKELPGNTGGSEAVPVEHEIPAEAAGGESPGTVGAPVVEHLQASEAPASAAADGPGARARSNTPLDSPAESGAGHAADAPAGHVPAGAFSDSDTETRQPEGGPRDAFVDTLDTFLARTAHNPFDLAAHELDRTARPEASLSAVEIARRWDTVARYGDWLAAHPDEDATHGAALDWQLERALFAGGDFGPAAGQGGVAGVGQGAANLQVLRGLAEGFQQL